MQTCIRDAGQDTRRRVFGWQRAGGLLKEYSDGRTTDAQPLLEVDGQPHKNGRRGGNRKKGESIQEKFPGGQGTRVNLGGGEREKGGTRTITDGKHSNLKIGTESRDLLSRCSGTGTPPHNNE